MAHKKAGGSTSLGRDSKGKRLGVKIFGGAVAKAGSIIVRQRGTKWHPGDNVSKGSDDTLFATINGQVHFQKKAVNHFTGKKKLVTLVHVQSKPAEPKETKAKVETKAKIQK